MRNNSNTPGVRTPSNPTWRPSLGPQAHKEAAGCYLSPISSNDASPQQCIIDSLPMVDCFRPEPTPASSTSGRTHYRYPSSTSVSDASPVGIYPGSRSRSRSGSGSGVLSNNHEHGVGSESRSKRSSCISTIDSGYLSAYEPSAEASFNINYESDESDDTVCSIKKPHRGTIRRAGAKRKRRLYIRVEDLVAYAEKKRQVSAPEITPQVQPPHLENQHEEQTHESTPVNTTMATRVRHISDAQSRTKFGTSHCESATDRSSDISDSDGRGSDSDQDDDGNPFNSVDFPHHKLDLLQMLGRSTPEYVHYTTNSCGGFSSGSGNGSENSVNSGSGKGTPSSATPNSSGSWTPGTQPGAAIDTKSPGDNGVAIGTSLPTLKPVPKPLELKCWHAAREFHCPGNKTGTSTEVRRLLDDHSFSKRSSNHHKLPPKCQRCDRLFENEDLAEQHKEKLKSDTPCNILPPEELDAFNSDLNLKGISPDRKNEIDKAIRSFTRARTLPTGQDHMVFDAWISRNRPIYIGHSGIPDINADRELGKWFVVWYTLFPDKEIPYHPFDDGALPDPKKCERILDLSVENIAEDSKQGLLPVLSDQHLDRIRRHIRNAIEIQCLELLQERNASQKARRGRKIMGSTPPNPSPSPLSMVTPAPNNPEFFPRDHPGAATFKEQAPCERAIGLPPSPAADQGTLATQIAEVPSRSQVPKTSRAEAPEQSSILPTPSHLSETQPTPYRPSIPSEYHSFEAMLEEDGLLPTIDLRWGPAEVDSLNFEENAPWNQDSFPDFGGPSII